MFFGTFIGIIIIQRLAELYIARQNERWMKEKGAIEFGQHHYPWMVIMHASFFIILALEVLLLGKGVSVYWPALLPLFIVAQAGRAWVLASLGKYWNTKIIVLPGAEIVAKGPYRYVKHPNYIIVASEILLMSLLFNAWMTCVLFSTLNIWMMKVRIPMEERALKGYTEYEGIFQPREKN
jgi:methyltransferase